MWKRCTMIGKVGKYKNFRKECKKREMRKMGSDWYYFLRKLMSFGMSSVPCSMIPRLPFLHSVSENF